MPRRKISSHNHILAATDASSSGRAGSLKLRLADVAETMSWGLEHDTRAELGCGISKVSNVT